MATAESAECQQGKWLNFFDLKTNKKGYYKDDQRQGSCSL
jgi:hypothetical protein